MAEALLKWSLAGKVDMPLFIAWCLLRNINSLIFEGNGSSSEQLSFKTIDFNLEYGHIIVLKNPEFLVFLLLKGMG